MILSSFQPIASAIIEIDSASPTWRTLPSSTFFWNCSRVRPAPIFCWNGSRRMRASWMRSTRMRSTRSQTPVSAIGSASITNPGFTPVPSTATFAFFASASIGRARTSCCPGRIGQLLGRRDDRDLELEDLLDLREHFLERRAACTGRRRPAWWS